MIADTITPLIEGSLGCQQDAVDRKSLRIIHLKLKILAGAKK